MRPTPRPARTRASRRSLAALAALVTAGVSGCSLLPLPGVGGPSTQELADGSTFLVAAPADGGDDAIVSGRLAVLGGNCIGLDMPESGESAALIFPHGTHPSEDGEAIVLPEGLSITLGQSIWGGGGYTTLSRSPDAFTLWPGAPDGCAGATYLADIRDVSTSEPPQA